jgi:diguanylate cyclase (GGDEF)-like protein/PAS domain S-box-containing protein/putative nucleotidyltransferase with HDIG domain
MKDELHNKSKKVRRSTHKSEVSNVENQQQMDALKQTVKIAEDKTKQLEIALNIIRQANISSKNKKKRDSLLQDSCDKLIKAREYYSVWIVLFDELGNLITSRSDSGIGHDFKTIIKRLKTGKSLKCIENAVSNSDVTVSDNPLINCCDCPLSMLYYGIECVSIQFKYHTRYGIITASLPHTLAHDIKEQKFLKEIADSLSSALYTIELEEERKLIEGTLRESEEKHRLLLESLHEGVWQIDAEGLSTFINPRMAQMLGYTVAEILGKHLFTFMDKQNIKRASYLFKRREKGISEQHEFEFIKKDGSILYANLGASPIINEEGEFLGSIAGVQDITERKRIEEELQRKELYFRTLIEGNTDGIMVLKRDGTIRYESPGCLRLLGYTLEERIGHSALDPIHPEDLQAASATFGQLASGLQARAELRARHKDGSWHIIEATLSNLLDDPSVKGIVVNLHDITERKQAEEALKESEEKYSTVVEQATEGITIIQDKLIKFANKHMAEMSGYTVEELTGMSTFDLVPPEFAPVLAERFAQRAKTQAVSETFYTQLLCKNGTVKEMENSTRLIQYEGRSAALGITRDITERKRMEEMLQESEERNRALVEAVGKAGTGIAILQTTPSSGAAIVFANKQASSISGYSHKELLSMSLKDVMAPEEYTKIITRYTNRQKGLTVRGYYETNIICKDGTLLPVEIGATALKLRSGIATVVYFKEIASRKKAEEKIALHTKHMQAILSVAQLINQTPTMNKMLTSALDKLNRVMSTDKACVYLIDFENKCLKMKSCRGISDKNIRRYSNLKLTEEQLHNLLMWKDPGTDFETIFGKTTGDRLKAALERNKACSYAMVPLLLKDKVIGILYNISDKDRTITEDDIKFLTAIAYEMSIGISNIQLLKRTVEMSLTDELTGLYNRRHFYETIETEMYRTKRYGQPFSLVLLDLDGFKEYNDKFGHTSGDAVLQLFAKKLKTALRKTDIACRYGGDEFAIILPSTDSKSAKTIIERFRTRWHKNYEKLLPIMKIPIDFSCGIAKFPDNSDSADGLVFLADTAMYCAKTDREHKSMLAAEISSIPSNILQAATQEHIYALAATVDAKDPHTYGHSKRVAAIAEKIGKAIGLSKEELYELYAAALLHDIGKIGVPDSILTKPERLTPEEWAIIKNHSTEGANIVGYVKELANLVPTIMHHHEWYDGKGYPYGLKGDTIPLGARITSVADAYDTMTTERPYRNLVSPEQACEELNRCSGTQFDPMVVDIWCKTILEPNL